MFDRTSIIAAVLITVLGATVAIAHQKSVSVSEGRIALPAAGETATAAFVVVDNPTMYDVYLVSASTDVAKEVQFREAAPGAAAKQKQEVTAPAYEKVEMKADGLHLWLVDLKRPLKAGETIPILLTTDNGITLNVSAVVR